MVSPYAAALQPFAPLIIMVGPPGSGKSTWAAGRFPVDQLFGLDMFRRMLTGGDVLEQDATDAAADMLTALLAYRMDTARTTVFDATNAHWSRRDAVLHNARRRGRPVVVVMMHTPLAVCLARNTARTSAPWPGANDRPVPPGVVERMHQAIEADPPTREEYDLIVHVHPDDPKVAYAYAGPGRSASWAQEFLQSDRWGERITLIPGGASLPWTVVNARV
jgi:predicted kinase